MKDYTITTWSDLRFGQVKFATDPDKKDQYSVRVRESWAPDPEVYLALDLIGDREGIVIDLGANIGTWCLPVARGSRATIIAVEALPDNCSIFNRAVQENGLAHRIRLRQEAVIDRRGVVRILGDSAYGTVSKLGDLEVPAISLDEILAECHVDKLLLAKIDIEGCEMMALKGGRKALSLLPDIIIEGNGAHCCAHGYLPQDMTRIFEDLGYNTFMVTGRKLIPASRETFQPFGLVNYLATTCEAAGLENFRVGSLTLEQSYERVSFSINKMKQGYRLFMREQVMRGDINVPPEIARLILGEC